MHVGVMGAGKNGVCVCDDDDDDARFRSPMERQSFTSEQRRERVSRASSFGTCMCTCVCVIARTP
jgi:hypothetical protein